jgi:CD109 antigen
VTIPVPPTLLQSRPNDYSSLVLTALNFYSNGTQVPDLESENYISIKNPEHIIVQSDKAKYKPGNLVQFRILTVNEDLAGLPADVSYKIKSPSSNVMSQGTKNSQNGVVEGNLQLDAYAEEGQWQIEVKAKTPNGQIEKTYSFDVEEYVLPKFEVTIAGDNFLVENEGKDYPFNIEGSAKSA